MSGLAEEQTRHDPRCRPARLVSHQTVSRVINGELSIAPATRARVERAIAELGFHPNHVARSLASRKTFTVGVVMGDVASPFFPDVVRGAEDVLSPLGYSLFLASSRRDPEVRAPQRRAPARPQLPTG